MGSTTGIELGPDTCVLARVRTTRAGSEVVALHTVEPASWPSHDAALAELLRDIRKSRRLPRHARVVAWGLPEHSTDESMARAAMRPLAAAGFLIDRVMSPPQALALLASTRVKRGGEDAGVAWLALNVHGAAIAIVRGSGELLFARTFQWTYNPHLFEARAQLLQRYSLVAHLAPELRRGIAAVRASHGTAVDAVVTCGDLPELRSLTMPLTEELDLEVETLDSLEGLRPVGKATVERLAESAPAIRLACAAALARIDRGGAPRARVARIAAAAALAAALGYGGYAFFTASRTTAGSSRLPKTTPRPASKPSGSLTAAPSVNVVAVREAAHPSVERAAAVFPDAAPSIRPTARIPDSSTLQRMAVRTESSPITGAATPSNANTVSGRQAPKPAAPAFAGPPIDMALSRRAAPRRTELARFPGARSAPLAAPLPRVDSILIDADRRLAIIDGAVASIGDHVGQRLVVQIERDAVVFEEPSGVRVRVPLRSDGGF